MKKVNFKNVLAALAVVFLFLFVGVATSSAQELTTEDIQAPAQGNFVNSDEAGVILLAEVEQLGIQLGGLPQGSPMYNSTRRQALYYRGIYREILNNNTVSESIGLGFGHLLNNSIDANGVTKSVLLDLRQIAIDLLSI